MNMTTRIPRTTGRQRTITIRSQLSETKSPRA